MESKEYFEKVMQDYNQNRRGRSLRKYCKDEAVDYDWLIEFKKNYPTKPVEGTSSNFIALNVDDTSNTQKQSANWKVSMLSLESPDGDTIEIKSSNLFVVVELLRKLA